MGYNNGDHLKVTYSSLEAAADAIMKEAKNLRADMEKVQQKVRSVSEIWEGEGQQAYQQAQHGWDQKADDIQNRLLAIAAEVRRAGHLYLAGDKRGRALFEQYNQ
ncbi:WXG100 family type VII secretion target [Streptomyces sp. 891-h]|uniref:WXG100 family type VII secretion target n=1 Tax=Streptomyces sp. 891-h TaxID=2720714 RepID=UPI001FAB06D6|nr:WXG100 family type VII secretion target [Streptomyces sp. 891-h]UNZ17058.1 WXG100 family type VII secretion target [Streptomyces sp. 891-h]